MTAGKGFRYQVGLIAGVKLVPEILNVPFNGPWRDAEFLSALLRR